MIIRIDKIIVIIFNLLIINNLNNTILPSAVRLARKNALSICHNCHALGFHGAKKRIVHLSQLSRLAVLHAMGFYQYPNCHHKKGYPGDERLSLTQIAIKICRNCWLSFVELLLALLATRALPVVRQVVECHAVVLCGVINIAADRADIFTGGFLLGEVHLGKYGGHRMV